MRGILCKVLIIFGIEDGTIRVSDGQCCSFMPTIIIVIGVAVDGKMGKLVDKCPCFGIGTGVWGFPEGTADVYDPEIIWIWSRDLSVLI